ncbi:MAG: hypothetical protein ACK4TA_11045 [Saprospiraceae bacterium]
MKFNIFIKALFIILLALGLWACPPLNFKIFVRNTTAESAQLILFYQKAIVKDTLHVKSGSNLIKIGNKTLNQLHETLIAIADSEKTVLIVPPHHTIFLNDLIEDYDELKAKTLIIKTKAQEDTLHFTYPYKNLKQIRRVSDRSYNYFYKTIIYYDIKIAQK